MPVLSFCCNPLSLEDSFRTLLIREDTSRLAASMGMAILKANSYSCSHYAAVDLTQATAKVNGGRPQQQQNDRATAGHRSSTTTPATSAWTGSRPSSSCGTRLAKRTTTACARSATRTPVSKALPLARPKRWHVLVGGLDRFDHLFCPAAVSKALPLPCAATAVLQVSSAFQCRLSFKLSDTLRQFLLLRPICPHTDVFLVVFSVVDRSSFDNVKNKVPISARPCRHRVHIRGRYARDMPTPPKP